MPDKACAKGHNKGDQRMRILVDRQAHAIRHIAQTVNPKEGMD